MSESMNSLTLAVEEAKVALQHAISEASRLKLTGTETELSRAQSHIESVLFEIERKTEPEFERFVGAVGSTK